MPANLLRDGAGNEFDDDFNHRRIRRLQPCVLEHDDFAAGRVIVQRPATERLRLAFQPASLAASGSPFHRVGPATTLQ